MFKAIHQKQLHTLLAIFLVVVLFWDSFALKPLKILVVFFHEISHGFAAIVTGGRMHEIAVVFEEGGHCITSGGSRFLILSAGYLGSLLWGGIILIGAARTRLDRQIMRILGVILLTMSLLYVRPFFGFGFFFGLLTATAMLTMASLASEEINDLTLRVIGLTSCLYAILDIKSDVIDRSHLRSDARMLSEITPLSTQVWGVIWIAIAVVTTFFILRTATRKTAT